MAAFYEPNLRKVSAFQITAEDELLWIDESNWTIYIKDKDVSIEFSSMSPDVDVGDYIYTYIEVTDCPGNYHLPKAQFEKLYRLKF